MNWLIDERRDAGGRIATPAGSGDRILTTGSAILALAATVTVGGERSHLLMALPFGVAITLVFGFYLNNTARTLSAYKIALENEIARQAGYRSSRDRHTPTTVARILIGSSAIGYTLWGIRDRWTVTREMSALLTGAASEPTA